MPADKTCLVEEWKTCRKEVQDFNNYLVKLRVTGSAIFIGSISIGLFLEIYSKLYGLYLFVIATVFILFFWGIDRRVSKLMVTVSARAQEIEKQKGLQLKLSSNIHKTWIGMQFLERNFDTLLYIFYVSIAIAISYISAFA